MGKPQTGAWTKRDSSGSRNSFIRAYRRGTSRLRALTSLSGKTGGEKTRVSRRTRENGKFICLEWLFGKPSSFNPSLLAGDFHTPTELQSITRTLRIKASSAGTRRRVRHINPAHPAFGGATHPRTPMFRNLETGKRACIVTNSDSSPCRRTLLNFEGNTNGRVRVYQPFEDVMEIQLPAEVGAVPPEFRTTGLSGICTLKRTRRDGYRWDEKEELLRTHSRPGWHWMPAGA